VIAPAVLALLMATAEAWMLPECSPAPDEVLLGELMALPVAGSVRRTEILDEDYHCDLVHPVGLSKPVKVCSGPHYTFGRPSSVITSASSDMCERPVRWPSMPSDWSFENGPVDVRGQSKDGSRWRWIGVFGSAIHVEGLTAAEIQIADALLERLCVRRPEPQETVHP
jgi:hypothetical protein